MKVKSIQFKHTHSKEALLLGSGGGTVGRALQRNSDLQFKPERTFINWIFD